MCYGRVRPLEDKNSQKYDFPLQYRLCCSSAHVCTHILFDWWEVIYEARWHIWLVNPAYCAIGSCTYSTVYTESCYFYNHQIWRKNLYPTMLCCVSQWLILGDMSSIKALCISFGAHSCLCSVWIADPVLRFLSAGRILNTAFLQNYFVRSAVMSRAFGVSLRFNKAKQAESTRLGATGGRAEVSYYFTFLFFSTLRPW